MDERKDCTDVARDVRRIVKGRFPETKFKVRSSRFSQGSAVDVNWTDGPLEAVVKDAIEPAGRGWANNRYQFLMTQRNTTDIAKAGEAVV